MERTDSAGRPAKRTSPGKVELALASALLAGGLILWLAWRDGSPVEFAPGASPTPTASAPQSPGHASLPDRLRERSWFGVVGDWGLLAATLGNDYLAIPEGEQPLAVTRGLVLTAQVAGQATIFLREIKTGDEVTTVKIDTAPLAGQIGDDDFYVTGIPPGGPADGADGQVPGLWRVTTSGVVSLVTSPRPVPSAWGEDDAYRWLLVSTSGRSVVTAVCHGPKGSLVSGYACDVDLIEQGASQTLLRDAGGPILVTDTVLVVFRVGASGLELEGRALANGERLWTRSLAPTADQVVVQADRDNALVDHRAAGTVSGGAALAKLNLWTGEAMDLDMSEVAGFIWWGLSGDGYAVYGPRSSIESALVSGAGMTKLSLFDVAGEEFRPSAWELRLPPK